MNHLILFAVSVGFGSAAWLMLAVADWLLADKPRPTAPQHIQSPTAQHFKADAYVTTITALSLNAPIARKAS